MAFTENHYHHYHYHYCSVSKNKLCGYTPGVPLRFRQDYGAAFSVSTPDWYSCSWRIIRFARWHCCLNRNNINYVRNWK